MSSRAALLITLAATSCSQPYSQGKASPGDGYAMPGASAINEQQWLHTADIAPPIDAHAGGCHTPLHEDTYYGFSVGFPPGWRIDYSTGTLMVTKDASDLVGAMIFPARLHRNDISAEHIGTVVAQGLERIVRGNGGTFSLSDQRTMGSVATAVVHATIGGVPVSGPLQIVVKPGFATVKLFWAPDGQLAAEQATLEQVTACFRRNTLITSKQPVAPKGGPVTQVGGHDAAPTNVQALRAFHGQYFNASMPAGWTVTNQTEHGIDLLSGDKLASAGFGWWTPMSVTPAQSIQNSLRRYYPGAQILKWNQDPAPPGWWNRQRGVGDSRTPARHLARVDEPQGRAVDGMVGRAAAMGSRGADARGDRRDVRDPAGRGREGARTHPSAARELSADSTVDRWQLDWQLGQLDRRLGSQPGEDGTACIATSTTACAIRSARRTPTASTTSSRPTAGARPVHRARGITSRGRAAAPSG